MAKIEYIPNCPYTITQCPVCGEDFPARNHRVAVGHDKYCSVKCLSAARRGTLEDKFWRSVQKTNGCWLWAGPKNRGGYGQISHGRNRHYIASRLSWEIHHGPIPEGLDVCHKCDNPQCVRPNHLFIGTRKDNMEDAKAKGRIAAGERHPMKKPGVAASGCRHRSRTHPELTLSGESHPHTTFTNSQVAEMRRLYAENIATRKEICEQFSVSNKNLGRILRRDRWTHVP